MVAITPKKANAQSLTCFVTLIVTACLAAILMITAFILPTMLTVTEIICWVSMALEAASIGLGAVAYWIKRNAL
jgi:hypothetical protein